MGRFEDALQALRERFDSDDVPEEIAVLEGYKGSELRKKAEERDAAVAERDNLKAENRRLKLAPKIAEALSKAGVDFDSLRPLERKAIDNLEFEGDAPSDEWVAQIVSEGGFPMVEGIETGEAGDEPAAAAIARQAKNAPAGGNAVGTITPETYASWPQEKRLRFRETMKKEHPDALKTLQDGGVLTGVAFK